MITAIIITLALLWICCIAQHIRINGLQQTVDRLCGIEDRQ